MANMPLSGLNHHPDSDSPQDLTSDSLEPFTDSLFFDLDLDRFLNSESYGDALGFRSSNGANGSCELLPAINEDSSFDKGGEVIGIHEDGVDTSLIDALQQEDFASTDALPLSTPGYGFLDIGFKDPIDDGVVGAIPTEIIEPLTSSNPENINGFQSTAAELIEPYELERSSTPPPPSSAIMMPCDPASPVSPGPSLSDLSSPTYSQHHTHHHIHITEADAHLMAIQESARMAAEEDKRRRNTAASARFRMKKKQRDAAIEKAAKDMADKVSNLEKKVTMLETENRWLRGLLIEKNKG